MIDKDTPIEINQYYNNMTISFLNHRFHINQENNQAQIWSNMLTELGFTQVNITEVY